MTTPRWYSKTQMDADLAGKVDAVSLEAQVAGKIGTGGSLDTALHGAYAGLTTRVLATSAHPAHNGELVACDTTSGTFPVTLPAASSGKARILVKWVAGTAAPTVALSGSDKWNTSTGSTSPLTPQLLNQGYVLESDGSGIWTVTADDLPYTQLLAALSATFASLPASGENTYYVSVNGNDSNNGRSPGTAFLTIGAALTAAGGSGAHIRLSAGNFTISAADASGNGITLNNASTTIEGEGVDRTTITFSANLGWGIVAQAARCKVAGIQFIVTTGKTITNAIVGASTQNKTSGSAEGIVFEKLYAVANSGSTVNACYAVGYDTTGGSIDLAFTEFRECVATGNNVATHGYYLGNGTAGNILLTGLTTCQANGCTNGLTAANTGFTWSRGGMSGNTTYDFNYLGGTQDPVVIQDGRFENGKRFLNSNASTGPYSGIHLIGNLLGNYTPSDNILISHSSLCALVMIGGQYCMSPGSNDSSLIQIGNGSQKHNFVAIGVLLNNPTGWPAATTWLRRTIIGAQTMDATGHPIANEAYQMVIDGGVARNEATKTANYSFGITDSIIISNGASLTHSLPDPTVATPGVTYSVCNANSSTCTVNSQGTSKTINGASSVTLAQWETGTWFSDGTQWIAVTNVGPSQLLPTLTTATFAAAQTVTWSSTLASQAQQITLTANMTSLTFSGGRPGAIYTLILIQDATGGRTLAGVDSHIVWSGTTPSLSNDASNRDIFQFIYDGTNYNEVTRQQTGAAVQLRGAITLVGNNSGGTSLTIGNNSNAADATINLQAPSGKVNQIQFKRAGANSWLLYDANSSTLYLRDNVNGVMAITFTPGAGTTGQAAFGGSVQAASFLQPSGSSGSKEWSGSGAPTTPGGSMTYNLGDRYWRTDTPSTANQRLYIVTTAGTSPTWTGIL